MIVEQNDFDLSILAPHFTEGLDYPREVILQELTYWQKNEPDFLIILSKDGDDINGFLVAYRNRDNLFISEAWRENDGDIMTSKEALDYARNWAKDRGMKSMSVETRRNEMKAMERLGLKEYSVIMRCEL